MVAKDSLIGKAVARSTSSYACELPDELTNRRQLGFNNEQILQAEKLTITLRDSHETEAKIAALTTYFGGPIPNFVAHRVYMPQSLTTFEKIATLAVKKKNDIKPIISQL